jgi:ornithine decarboxylase
VDLRCIMAEGIQLTTFDSESELHKIKAARLDEVPGFAVVLRIRADDPKAKMQFGSKYGAGTKTVPRLLETAKVLGLNVAGVSFHVGSGSMSPDAYDNAIAAAKDVFNMAVAAGHPPPTLLDIGGGFTSSFVGSAGEVSEYPSNFRTVAAAIDRLFPVVEYPHLRCISEPGRYFAGTSVTIAAMVYGKRKSEVGRVLLQVEFSLPMT